MTDNQKLLIQYVINNNLAMARKYANVILATNKTAKDQAFCEKMLTRMEQQEHEAIQIPANLQHIIQTSCTAYKFDPSRYYVSEREAEVLDHVKKMYIVGERLAKMGVHYTNAVLLHGESGTGKTTFAQYIADALKLPFLYVNLTQAIDAYLGKTGQNMDLIFKFAFSLPCVICIDEIDAIGTKRREDGGVSGELKRVLINVMQNLDCLPNNVILVAATNRPDVIDPALLRRFSVKHEVKNLSAYEACELVRNFLWSSGLDFEGDLLTFLHEANKTVDSPGLPDAETYNAATVVNALTERIAATMLQTDSDVDTIQLQDNTASA